MKKYIVIEGEIFDIYESSMVFEDGKQRFVITMTSKNLDIERLLDLLKKMLINNQDKDYLRMLLEGEIPIFLLKQEYIRDHEFIDKYHPEYLV